MIEIIMSDIDNLNINLGKLKNKSILITGSTGLIGIYLLASLKKYQKEYNINIYTWYRNEITIFKEFFKDCNLIIGDITDEKNFENLPNFDYIIHAAGYGQPGKFLENKIKTIQLNTYSTIKLLDKLKVSGSFLFVSTSELYNGLEKLNIDENEIGSTNTNNNRSCYIEGKRCGESICHSYIESGKNVKIVRLSLAYGPGNLKNDARVLYSLMQKGLTEESINLLDGGDAIRTYCYITDIIEMFWNIFLYGKENTYNVAGKSVTSIYELASQIGKKLNKEVKTNTKSLLDSPKIVNLSIDRYLNEFGNKNFVSLEEGLNKTLEWQKKLYNYV